jgi:uncharacterized protein DUF4154
MRARRLVTAALLAAGLAAGAPPVDRADGPPAGEYEVKAAFLFNFAKFVEWPEAALPADGTFVIAVLGADPFGHALDDLEGRVVLGRRIVVKRWRDLGELAACQLLFVSASEDERLGDVLRAVASRPVLTVSDGDGFAERGVMINFRTRDRRIRFEINLERAETAGLKMSSQLLKLAALVKPQLP